MPNLAHGNISSDKALPAILFGRANECFSGLHTGLLEEFMHVVPIVPARGIRIRPFESK